jgi:hypothetical protein
MTRGQQEAVANRLTSLIDICQAHANVTDVATAKFRKSKLRTTIHMLLLDLELDFELKAYIAHEAGFCLEPETCESEFCRTRKEEMLSFLKHMDLVVAARSSS